MRGKGNSVATGLANSLSIGIYCREECEACPTQLLKVLSYHIHPLRTLSRKSHLRLESLPVQREKPLHLLQIHTILLMAILPHLLLALLPSLSASIIT